MKLTIMPVLIAVTAAATLACGRDDPDSITASGTVEAVEVDVGPLSTGRVERVLVEEGDLVRAGDTVAVLRQPTAQAELEQREARVAASRAGLEELERGPRSAEIARAAAELRALEAEAIRAAADAERARGLAAAGALAPQQLEAAETSARTAAGRRDAARQTLNLLRQGSRPERISGARADVIGARASLSATEAAIHDLTLLAPVEGVVLTRSAEPGEVIPPGRPVVTLGDVRQQWVRVYVKAADLPFISVGDSARAIPVGLAGQSFVGRIASIATKAEFTPRVALTEDERADQMFAVKIDFEDTTGFLKPGLPVTVTIRKNTRRP